MHSPILGIVTGFELSFFLVLDQTFCIAPFLKRKCFRKSAFLLNNIAKVPSAGLVVLMATQTGAFSCHLLELTVFVLIHYKYLFSCEKFSSQTQIFISRFGNYYKFFFLFGGFYKSLVEIRPLSIHVSILFV